MERFRIEPSTRMAWVSLIVSDIERSLRFYTELLGLGVVKKGSDGGIMLGPSPETVVATLYEQQDAQPAVGRRGLYHYALLLPNRRDLARVFVRIARRWNFEGFADHLVSEALYIRDPDGHGIELYADRSSTEWMRNPRGEIEMATFPLDVDSLLMEHKPEGTSAALADDWRMPEGTRLGHVHLHVSSLARAAKFYHETLGFDITNRSYPGALFMSAGGYHHHIAVNIWAGTNAPPPSPNHARLRSFAAKLPSRQSLEKVVERLKRGGFDVHNSLTTSVAGYDGFSVLDFDGNVVELVCRRDF
ncbi:MAG: VOC family protein [Candidatus Caldarchaeum sp.]